MKLNFSSDLTAKVLTRTTGPRKIDGIVLHDTAGSGTHGDTLYLANDPEGRKVSVDFTVERDGSIHKLNPDLSKYYCNHAGRKTNWRAKGLVGQDINKRCVGIEISQKANLALVPMWPDEQVKAVAQLCAWLCDAYGLVKADITTHAQIITDGSRTDPRQWPFGKFWEYFNSILATEAADHVMPEDSTLHHKVYHTVVKGDTLSALANKYSTTIEKIKALNDMDSPSTLIKVGQILLVKE